MAKSVKPKKLTAAQKLRKAKAELFQRALTDWCRVNDLPVPNFEYRFHPTRMWRFDVAFPLRQVAIEVHGGLFRFGHHSRGKGFLDDREKMAEAQRMGWRVLEVAPSGNHPNTMYSPAMLNWLRSVL